MEGQNTYIANVVIQKLYYMDYLPLRPFVPDTSTMKKLCLAYNYQRLFFSI